MKNNNKQKKVAVLGGNGFIGHHMVKKLKELGYWVRVVDIQKEIYSKSLANEVVIGDLRDYKVVKKNLKNIDEVYQFAADMGGAGYIFTGNNDANVMHNSAQINLNILDVVSKMKNKPKILYSSSACVYPEYNQLDPNNPLCSEESAYPAAPDSEYGWEKLFSERMYLAYRRNYKLDTKVVRYHNIFGPETAWNNGKEKSPAAICRKVAEAKEGTEIEIWGSGNQTRSFLYIDECIEGTIKLMESNIFNGPVNVGSEEMISINNLAKMVIDISGKNLQIKNIPGPLGVNGRNSHNDLCKKELNWEPIQPLRVGMEKLYKWIEEQVRLEKNEV
jgi:nucleoside-diphosphate-sugar epimerase